jgi:hypothetical protein
MVLAASLSMNSAPYARSDQTVKHPFSSVHAETADFPKCISIEVSGEIRSIQLTVYYNAEIAKV